MANAFDIAAQQIGLNEHGQRAALSDYLQTGGQNLDPAVTAWCAAFVDASLQQSGGQGTGALNARSYMDWGQGVDEPQRGDVAVFSRGDPNGWQGHVGFFDSYNDDGSINVLGGNQSDSVSVQSYGADRLLGFRRGDGQPQQPNAAQSVIQPPQQASQSQQGQQQANALQRIAPPPQMRSNALNAADFMNPMGRNALNGGGYRG